MALQSFLFFDHSRASSTFTPLLHEDNLPHISNPTSAYTTPALLLLASAIDTVLGIWNSSILSTCQNHLNTLRSTLLANSLSNPAHISTSSLITETIQALQSNFSNTSSQEHPLSFSQHFSYPMPLLRTTPLVQLLLHRDTLSGRI